MTKSIGDILRRARERKRLTIDDVYKKIKIHPTYIRAMEIDNYSVFSGKVHSKGFLKIYSEFLDLGVDEMLALWRREYESEFDDRADALSVPKKSIEPPKLLITPGVVLTLSIISALLLFFGYLFYQYRNFTGEPALDIYYPPNNLVTAADIMDITGKTDIDSQVFVNNQKVNIGPDGSFVESVRLKEGLNTLTIKSVNKYQKQTEYLRTIIYRPDREEVRETSTSADTSPAVVLP